MEANKTTYSVEYITEIWDDKSGDRLEFGEDRDSLGLVEIRSRLSNGDIEKELVLKPEQAYLLGKELVKRYGNSENESSTNDDFNAHPNGHPTFNHTRGDGPYEPCPECLVKMSRGELVSYANSLQDEIRDLKEKLNEQE